jgi:dihydropyrimidinase
VNKKNQNMKGGFMKIDTLITNGTVVTPQEVLVGMAIGVSAQKIAFLGKKEAAPKAAEVIDAGGNYIMPGTIETHAHLGAGPPTFEDDVLTETKAAAAGGVTTVLHFIAERGSILERLPYYVDTVAQSATTDIGFHACIMFEPQLQEISALAKKGMKGFKFLMAYQGNELETLGIFGVDYRFLYRGMERVKEAGGLAMVHAENYQLLKLFEEKFNVGNVFDPEYERSAQDFVSFNLSRPAMCVEIDTYAACRMAENISVPLIIVHTTTGRQVKIANAFRARGQVVYVETMPHYLTHDYSGKGFKRPHLAMSPPAYQTKADMEALWEGIATGEVNAIGTDMDNGFWNQMPTELAVMLSEGVNKKRLTLPQLVTANSYSPAQIFGLYPKKGVLLPGSDADIIVVDLKKKVTVRADLFPGYCQNFNPYEDWQLKGWPILSMVRGKVVMRDGKVEDAIGWGRAANVRL